MILGKKYDKESWIQFLVDYNPEHSTPGEVVALYWPQLKFYEALQFLLAPVGFDLEKMKKDDDPAHYMAFLCFCSWVGHGINLLTDLENTEKVKELDYMLTAYRDSVHDSHPNVMLARDLCQVFDNFINEVQYYFEEIERNSEDYYSDTDDCFNFLVKQENEFGSARLEILKKAKPAYTEKEEENGEEEE